MRPKRRESQGVNRGEKGLRILETGESPVRGPYFTLMVVCGLFRIGNPQREVIMRLSRIDQELRIR